MNVKEHLLSLPCHSEGCGHPKSSHFRKERGGESICTAPSCGCDKYTHPTIPNEKKARKKRDQIVWPEAFGPEPTR